MKDYIYEDILPNALAIGIRQKDFWRMTMRDLKPEFEAFKLRNKHDDQMMWLMGIYVQSAVLTALDKAFSGSKSKMKYIENPLMSEDREKNDLGIHDDMTEEEKKEATEKLFRRLEVMQGNFSRTNDKG